MGIASWITTGIIGLVGLYWILVELTLQEKTVLWKLGWLFLIPFIIRLVLLKWKLK